MSSYLSCAERAHYICSIWKRPNSLDQKHFWATPAAYIYTAAFVCVCLYHNTARRRHKDSSASSGSVWNNLVKCAVAGQVCSALGACHFHYSFTVTVSVYLTCVCVCVSLFLGVCVCVSVRRYCCDKLSELQTLSTHIKGAKNKRCLHLGAHLKRSTGPNHLACKFAEKKK